MTDTSADAVAKVLDGVTDGPWRTGRKKTSVMHGKSGGRIADTFQGWNMQSRDEAHARFIAAARQLVPALSSDLEAMRARAEQAEADRDKVFDQTSALEVAAHRRGYNQGKAAADIAMAGSGDLLEKTEAERDALQARVTELLGALDRITNIGVAWSDSFENQIDQAKNIARAALSREGRE